MPDRGKALRFPLFCRMLTLSLGACRGCLSHIFFLLSLLSPGAPLVEGGRFITLSNGKRWIPALQSSEVSFALATLAVCSAACHRGTPLVEMSAEGAHITVVIYAWAGNGSDGILWWKLKRLPH